MSQILLKLGGYSMNVSKKILITVVAGSLIGSSVSGLLAMKREFDGLGDTQDEQKKLKKASAIEIQLDEFNRVQAERFEQWKREQAALAQEQEALAREQEILELEKEAFE